MSVEPFHHFCTPPSVLEFEAYMRNNIPCTFGPWISEDWPAASLWVTLEGRPAFQHLTQVYGHCTAPVTRYPEENSEAVCEEEPIAEFLERWKAQPPDKRVQEFPAQPSPSIPAYLKDWHFTRDSPEPVYSVPPPFADDWLNSYWRSRDDVTDDYVFAYLGPAGSYTPFHADVFRSYSWSVNLCGAKRWLILWPGEEERLTGGRWNVEQEVREKGLRCWVVDQGPREGIFVPSGWWHQVLNTAHTISINHNWANFHCVPRMWAYLKAELGLVEREIEDVRELCTTEEWEEQCQVVLRANVGWSFAEFRTFVRWNAEKGVVGEGRLYSETDMLALERRLSS